MKSLNKFKVACIFTILFYAVAATHLRSGPAPQAAAPQAVAPQAAAAAKPASSPEVAAGNMTQLIANLFFDTTHPPECLSGKDKKDEEEEQANAVNITDDGTVWSLPRPKPNKHEKKKLGWDSSAYFFDYLDDVLQKDIVKEFDRIFKEAQKIQSPADYKDPYALEKILGLSGKNVPPKEELYKKIVSISPSFNPSVWESSISIGQMQTILKEWNWFANTAKPDPAKYIVDRYDFDGDGRLNPREFLIAMIRNNKRIVEGEKKCNNCMEHIIATKIDPIHIFLDCGAKDQITAEQIWVGLQKLKRPKLGYDIYKCSLEAGKYRTSAVNDFILKSHKMVEGKLTKEEFRLGLLTGYWDRHTDNNKIYLDDSHNMKTMRWAQDGNVDIICEKILSSIKKAKGF
jgi:hypothetical protein